MTPNEKKELAAALQSLFELDRMAGCSDRYFRQVCTAKINAIRAAGFREKLEAEIQEDPEPAPQIAVPTGEADKTINDNNKEEE